MKLRPGARVAHSGIESDTGAARAGVVEEVIGDDDSALVVTRLQGERARQAFDNRELVPLLRGSDGGPIVLRPRHLLHLLRRPLAALSFLFVVLVVASLVYLSLIARWEPATILICGLFAAFSILVAVSVLELRARRRHHSG